MPEAGSFNGADHLYRVRVYYEDTDAAGMVYYANYLRLAERARTEMMRLLGAGHAEMAAKDGVVMAVRDCAIEYLSPAKLDDVVEIRTTITQLLGAGLRAVPAPAISQARPVKAGTSRKTAWAGGNAAAPTAPSAAARP